MEIIYSKPGKWVIVKNTNESDGNMLNMLGFYYAFNTDENGKTQSVFDEHEMWIHEDVMNMELLTWRMEDIVRIASNKLTYDELFKAFYELQDELNDWDLLNDMISNAIKDKVNDIIKERTD